MRNHVARYSLLALILLGVIVWPGCHRNQSATQLHRIQQQSNELAKPVAHPTGVTPATTSSADEVYITRTGKCYHRASCSSLSRSKIPIALADAKAQGFRACQRCGPPE